MRKRPKPTDAELGILRVLWTRGPSTVRQVHDALNQERPIGYTTALKLLQIMADKGLVARDETDRTHVYTASVSESETQRQLLDDLMARAFRGSAMTLVMRALSGARATPHELSRIRQLLDEYEEGSR
jgi:BlaI family transcriptional regulator, penicillinase repressor